MPPSARSVSIVTQTRVRPEHNEEFARWQGETSSAISRFPGFLEQQLLPPNPPLQVDWVILQRFASLADAQRWLGSAERQKRIAGAAQMLVGQDDVHIVQDEADGIRPAPVSTIISTRVKPGKEAEYRAWVRRIAAEQSKAPGLQGYRFEPPVPGVQQHFIAILRFDTEANLRAWLESPVRQALLKEAEPLTEETHARIASSGFEQWFRDASPGDAPLPVWKMDMLVLLMLYPIVMLFGYFIGTPLLDRELHLPFAVSLFLGNIASVFLTGFLVPWIAGRFGWWLRPAPGRELRTNLLGAAFISAICVAMVFVFLRLF
ncbi:antibiotic biosynthesis monooxygenase [Reyranella sp.]|uniref:antibiotic biosynthesis monooxygenase n=1 Tax=Reyranella sp. TaxID=1929291 RepID=UPI002719A1C1|nr:antibiotic biosynthesis monooxygenase [Reyranella sp.]MDO8973233.1 antibiotic biosynthesis monooxygenase [Reyranella sp.]